MPAKFAKRKKSTFGNTNEEVQMKKINLVKKQEGGPKDPNLNR